MQLASTRADGPKVPGGVFDFTACVSASAWRTLRGAERHRLADRLEVSAAGRDVDRAARIREHRASVSARPSTSTATSTPVRIQVGDPDRECRALRVRPQLGPEALGARNSVLDANDRSGLEVAHRGRDLAARAVAHTGDPRSHLGAGKNIELGRPRSAARHRDMPPDGARR
jgi:hypothetical protein